MILGSIMYILFKVWLYYLPICFVVGGIYGIVGSFNHLSSEQYKNSTIKTTVTNYFMGMITCAIGALFLGHVIPLSYIYFFTMDKLNKSDKNKKLQN